MVDGTCVNFQMAANHHVETESQLIETYRKHQEHVDLSGLFTSI